MKKVLLLIPPNKKGFIRDVYYGCWHKKKFIDYSWPPIGLYQLDAVLKKNFESLVVDGSILNDEQTLSKIKDFSPDFVIINVGTFTFKDDLAYIKQVKGRSKVIVYGEFATTSVKECLSETCIEYAIKGEPEGVISNLLNNIENPERLKKIDGVCFEDYIHPNSAFVHDLDSLPFPTRGINEAISYQNPFTVKKPFTTVLTTRGCPHSCIFCTVPVLYGKTFRRRSVKNVLEELKMLKEQGFKEIFFRDENITLHKKIVQDLCKGMIKNELKFSWMCNSRIDTINKETLELMKESGCFLIKFGVESGNQEIIDNIKKGIRLVDVENIFKICKKLGIGTVAHFMIGNLGDDEEAIKKTIDFAIKLDPDYASFDKVIIYPGTDLSKINYKPLDDGLLEHYHNLAFKRFYLRPTKVIKQTFKLMSFEQLKKLTEATFVLWKSLLKK